MLHKQSDEWVFWAKLFVIALIFALIVRSFLFSPIIVDGPSMQPTLHDRDQMIVNKFIYRFKQPDRFDIVIFHASNEKDFIKRVIGLPGEHVAVRDNQLYIDNEPIEQKFLEPYEDNEIIYPVLTNDFSLEKLPGDYDVIPDNHILVLGDNRTNSTDSRSFGLVSMDQVVGKTNIVYWPLKRIHVVNE